MEEVQDRFGTLLPSPLFGLPLDTPPGLCLRQGFTLIKQDKFSLIIEKHKGKEASTRKLLAPKYKTPQEMENKIIAELKKTSETLG